MSHAPYLCFFVSTLASVLFGMVMWHEADLVLLGIMVTSLRSIKMSSPSEPTIRIDESTLGFFSWINWAKFAIDGVTNASVSSFVCSRFCSIVCNRSWTLICVSNASLSIDCHFFASELFSDKTWIIKVDRALAERLKSCRRSRDRWFLCMPSLDSFSNKNQLLCYGQSRRHTFHSRIK